MLCSKSTTLAVALVVLNSMAVLAAPTKPTNNKSPAKGKHPHHHHNHNHGGRGHNGGNGSTIASASASIITSSSIPSASGNADGCPAPSASASVSVSGLPKTNPSYTSPPIVSPSKKLNARAVKGRERERKVKKVVPQKKQEPIASVTGAPFTQASNHPSASGSVSTIPNGCGAPPPTTPSTSPSSIAASITSASASASVTPVDDKKKGGKGKGKPRERKVKKVTKPKSAVPGHKNRSRPPIKDGLKSVWGGIKSVKSLPDANKPTTLTSVVEATATATANQSQITSASASVSGSQSASASLASVTSSKA